MCPLKWTQFFNSGSAILTSLWIWNYAQAIPGFALAHYKNNSEQLHTQPVFTCTRNKAPCRKLLCNISIEVDDVTGMIYPKKRVGNIR
jgi:hypothetical protein